MSEAELHVLRARLIGGQLNKARRGELSMPTPLGYVVSPDGKLMLDPDEQVQGAVRLVFETFQRTGSAGMVVRYFREQEIAWPQRVSIRPRAGTFVTGALGHRRVLQILHNPRYAGAYVYGRTRQRKLRLAGQPAYRRLPREEWTVFRRTRTRVTSPGSSTKRIRLRCLRMPGARVGTGAAHRARALRYCRGSSSAVDAVTV